MMFNGEINYFFYHGHFEKPAVSLPEECTPISMYYLVETDNPINLEYEVQGSLNSCCCTSPYFLSKKEGIVDGSTGVEHIHGLDMPMTCYELLKLGLLKESWQ